MAVASEIRSASVADVPEMAAAERVCFSDPWSASGLLELFNSATVEALVAEVGGPNSRLAGYIFARMIAGEAEILNIAVLPPFRRAGLGSELLDQMLGKLRDRGTTVVFLEVRESNDDAKRLYASRGFRPVGLRPDYYRNPRENALVLRLDLSAALN